MGYSGFCNSAAILCGGEGSRMGCDKGALLVEGRPILLRQLDLLRPLFDETLLIGTRPAGLSPPPDIAVFPDELPGRGPLGGLYTALGVARSRAVFLVANDMPFLQTGLIRRLLDAADASTEAVVYRSGELLEPLHALYACSTRNVARELIDAGRLRMKYLIERVRTVYLDIEPHHPAFFNVNRPEDLLHLPRPKFETPAT
jgi:molybdopterin-guanine dinucleotide biosynthesis protein A